MNHHAANGTRAESAPAGRTAPNPPTGSRLDDADRVNLVRTVTLLQRLRDVTKGGWTALAEQLGLGEDSMQQRGTYSHAKAGQLPLHKIHRLRPAALIELQRYIEELIEGAPEVPISPERRMLRLSETVGALSHEVLAATADGAIDAREEAAIRRAIADVEGVCARLKHDVEALRNNRSPALVAVRDCSSCCEGRRTSDEECDQ